MRGLVLEKIKVNEKEFLIIKLLGKQLIAKLTLKIEQNY